MTNKEKNEIRKFVHKELDKEIDKIGRNNETEKIDASLSPSPMTDSGYKGSSLYKKTKMRITASLKNCMKLTNIFIFALSIHSVVYFCGELIYPGFIPGIEKLAQTARNEIICNCLSDNVKFDKNPYGTKEIPLNDDLPDCQLAFRRGRRIRRPEYGQSDCFVS